MKKPVFLNTVILCIAIFNHNSHADNHTELENFVNFKELDKVYGEPKVKINLEKSLISMLAGFAKNNDPGAGEVLNALEAVTVNVYNMGDNTDAAFDSIRDVSARMQKLNWMSAVSVNEGNELVRIFVKENKGMIEGLVVLAAGKNDEAVFINIVGNIDPAKIAQVTQSLNLDVDLGKGVQQDEKK